MIMNGDDGFIVIANNYNYVKVKAKVEQNNGNR